MKDDIPICVFLRKPHHATAYIFFKILNFNFCFIIFVLPGISRNNNIFIYFEWVSLGKSIFIFFNAE